ncbi:MAG: Rqc2 family fibronectin-binding protein [Peptococcales bacterium]|jgi:predicted ribosome quality control (RQC) complex YloA/Tae2 family protein
MSLDGIAIHALVDELKPQLVGGRVDKIQQPDSNSIIITLRQPGKNLRLFITVNPQSARFHMTQTTRPNPLEPPLFCMVLRKHLEGAKLIDIRQKGLERIVHFLFEGFDELGNKVTRILIGEFMGKHSNLILIKQEEQIILDSIKRLSHAVNQYREVLPGKKYILPPPQEKMSLEEINEESLVTSFLNLSTELKVHKALLTILEGIGPQTAKELLVRADIAYDNRLEFLGEYEYLSLLKSISWLKNLVNEQSYEPTLIKDSTGKPFAFAPFYLKQFTGFEHETFESMSNLIEFFIGKSEEKNLFKQKLGDLERILARELERCQRKLALQLEKQEEGQKADKFKLWGELLTANLYKIKQGKEAKVTNFYSEKLEDVIIPLEPNLTPNENAQKYFHKYAKAKSGSLKALKQSKITLAEINYLETIQNSLARSENLTDLQEIRWELGEAEYLKARPTKNKSKGKGTIQSKPLTFITAGFTILVGKNNKQNDYVTFKLGKNDDTWLHVKDIPGSHVIIKNPEKKVIPKDVLDIAANLAAYFSKGHNSSHVPVDYTLRKNVKKPNGAKPGMVIYENQKTIYITPDEEKVERLLKEPGL